VRVTSGGLREGLGFDGEKHLVCCRVVGALHIGRGAPFDMDHDSANGTDTQMRIRRNGCRTGMRKHRSYRWPRSTLASPGSRNHHRRPQLIE